MSRTLFNKNVAPSTATAITQSTSFTIAMDGIDQLSLQPVYADATPAVENFVAANVLPSVAATGNFTIVDYTQLAGKTVTVAGHVLTEGADWIAATSNGSTATSLASAIDALTEVSSAAASAVVNITATPVGTGGNAVTLATNGVIGAITKSGTVLSGGTDVSTITITGTSFATGLKVALTGTNLPTGLTATNYWVIKRDANTIRLATSLVNANAGTYVVISAAGTTADAALTAAVLAAVVKLQAGNDGSHWTDISGDTVSISSAGSTLWNIANPAYSKINVVVTMTTGVLNLTVQANAVAVPQTK